MRSYSGLLLFEDIFEFIPTTHPDIVNLANSIFTPNLMIVENDCGTTLGKFEVVNFEAEGLVELATGDVISNDRIIQLLSMGIYEVATHHVSTCISKGGVCATCFAATYQDKPVPKYKDRVVVLPEYLVNAEIVGLKDGISSYTMLTDYNTYEKTYAYLNGVRLIPGVDYTISTANLLTLTTAPTEDANLVVRCVKQNTAPFLVWLSNTYSGSIFGMKPLPSEPLPLRSLLLSSLLTENRLQLISEFIKSVKAIPADYASYSDQIRDPLEKALYMLALYAIYSNVIN